MELKDRFRSCRLALNLSQDDLSKLAKVTQAAINKVETGQTKKPRNLAVYAGIFGVTESWLEYGTGPAPSFLSSYAGNSEQTDYFVSPNSLGLDSSELGTPSSVLFVDIPFYNVQLAAGIGLTVFADEAVDTRPIPYRTIHKTGVQPDKAAVVTVIGESMEHTLLNGDEVLVDTSVKRPHSNGIFAFAFEDELRVKRFSKQMDGSWRVISDNPDKSQFPDEFIAASNMQSVRIIGKVVSIVERTLI